MNMSRTDKDIVIGTVTLEKNGKVVKCIREMVKPDLVRWIC
jgi:hypothetical protein